MPRFDSKTKCWRGADGRFMKLGVPVNGWVLVRCEACGRPFPTTTHALDPRRPDHFFCTEECRVSGKVAEVVPEAERDEDIVKRYQRGEPGRAIQQAHGISAGTLYRILHRHGVESSRREP